VGGKLGQSLIVYKDKAYSKEETPKEKTEGLGTEGIY
jgi:hypothetical protein